jgi:hypothetical protein
MIHGRHSLQKTRQGSQWSYGKGTPRMHERLTPACPSSPPIPLPYLPPCSCDTGGGITSATAKALDARGADIRDFLSFHAGSLIALSQMRSSCAADRGINVFPYAYLPK